jgi:thioredoxin 1
VNRRMMMLGGALSLAGLFGAAQAVEPKAFDKTAFEVAQAKGQSILVEVTAPWCTVCQAQKPILASLRARPEFKDLVVFEVDFDTQKDFLRAMNVQKQSTLIAFKGRAETGRSTGETYRASIEALLRKAL